MSESNTNINNAAANDAAPQLTVAELQTLAQVIELATRRGAFQASEIKQIGEAYEKLTEFLKYIETVRNNSELNKAKTN